MRRRLFTILCGLSLLVCIVTVFLWARSCWYYDDWQHWDQDRDRLWCVIVQAGGIQVGRADDVSEWLDRDALVSSYGWQTAPAFRRDWQVFTGDSVTSYHDWAGFRLLMGSVRPSACGYWSIRVPLWAFIACGAICPACWLRVLIRQHRRREKGLCLNCGYDLRASVERCPECGMPRSADSNLYSHAENT